MPSKEILKEFAKLAVIVGTNIQEGQPLSINAPVEAYEFVEECVKVAYEQKASRVNVEFQDEKLTRMNYEYCSTEVLKEMPEWAVKKLEYGVEKGYAMLNISSGDPDLLAGIDPNKIREVRIAQMNKVKPFMYYTMNNVGQWSIVAYPNLKWAKKVFPNLNDEEAIEALWDAILKTSRVELNKTVENWQKHNEEIKQRSKKLNDYNFKSLHFTSSNGTDIEVGLIKDHIWEGGSDYRKDKKCQFNPNIPTEEIFTMPDRRNINGIVYSTKPLSYGGVLINSFNLTFKDGKVVEYHAENNEETLKGLLETDEGSLSLGEVALISYDSPISNLNILFFDTLFDENASCHLALGACYPTNIKGGSNLSREELYELGGNDSMNHVDFMFGYKDTRAVGKTYDGKEVVIFDQGNFII